MTTPTGPDPARLSASTHQPETRCICPVGSDAVGPHTRGCPCHPEAEAIPRCRCATLRPGDECPAHRFDPSQYVNRAPQQPSAIDSPLIAVHDTTADQTQQPPAQERLVGSGWHGADPCGGPVCPYSECTAYTAYAPPSEPVSLPRQQRDTVQQAKTGAKAMLAWRDAHPRSTAAAMEAFLAGWSAASPGVQGGDGEAPTSSEPRSDLTSAPGMSSPLDGEARERLARWLWERDGMKPEQWSQAREATRQDWLREADLALRAAGGPR